ncbi:MAG: hypothetical protein ACRDV9_04360, partial [Acidimicrobiia bacterium]
VFGLPERFQRVHRATVESEAETVGAALEAQLGRRVRVRVVTRESVVPIEAASEAPASAPEAAADDPEPGAPAESGARALDSVGLMIEAFGATVESDVPHD